MSEGAAARFVVRRRDWRRGAAGWVCLPGGVPVASFGSFDEADADRARREEEYRGRLNPFDCGRLAHLTRLPEPVFRDWLRDAGIEPPAEEGTRADWPAWWSHAGLTADQRAAIWHGLDRVRFFDVDEPHAGPTAHVVVLLWWEDNGRWYYSDVDGGWVRAAFRDRGAAGRFTREESATSRAGWADLFRVDGEGQFEFRRPSDVADPFDPRLFDPLTPINPFRTTIETEFCESAEVPLEGEPGETVSVVVRLGWSRTETGLTPTGNEVGMPVAAFADHDAATAQARRLERDARAGLTPFRLNPHPQDLTLHSEPALEVAVRALGLPVPDDGNWAGWWDERVEPAAAQRKPWDLSNDLRDAAWDLFDRARFYAVVETLVRG